MKQTMREQRSVPAKYLLTFEKEGCMIVSVVKEMFEINKKFQKMKKYLDNKKEK